MITHAAGLTKFLVKIWSPTVVYNVEEEYYFTRGGMGVTSVVHYNTEISDSKTTSNPSANKVIISGLWR